MIGEEGTLGMWIRNSGGGEGIIGDEGVGGVGIIGEDGTYGGDLGVGSGEREGTRVSLIKCQPLGVVVRGAVFHWGMGGGTGRVGETLLFELPDMFVVSVE